MLPWHKTWGRKCLYGSLRSDSEAFRGVWYDLQNIASAISPRAGYIEMYSEIPLTIEEISQEWVIDIDILRSAWASFVKEGRLKQDKKTGSWYLTNWNKYQSIPLGCEQGELKKTLGEARLIRGTRNFVKKHKNMSIIDKNTGEIIG